LGWELNYMADSKKMAPKDKVTAAKRLPLFYPARAVTEREALR